MEKNCPMCNKKLEEKVERIESGENVFSEDEVGLFSKVLSESFLVRFPPPSSYASASKYKIIYHCKKCDYSEEEKI